jgi:uncharacterized protein (TIGR02147 family)
MPAGAFKNNLATESERPQIFIYKNYKDFLRDYLHYLKLTDPNYSTRKFAHDAKISLGYLSTILNSEQHITQKAVEKILPCLKLTKIEASYFKILCTISESSSQDDRMKAVAKLKRFGKFTALNPEESLVSEYMSKWYYVAIREMANQPGFQANAIWIQEQLNFHVPVPEIAKALEFLIMNKLIRFKPDGGFEASGDRVKCEGNLFRFILTHFYKQVFDLAVDAIDNINRDERNIRGHTMCLTKSNYAKAKAAMDNALEEIAKLKNDPAEGSATYQFLLLGFPFVKVRQDGEE